MWHKWYENGWSGWESLGGILTSAPSAVSHGGRIASTASRRGPTARSGIVVGGRAGARPLRAAKRLDARRVERVRPDHARLRERGQGHAGAARDDPTSWAFQASDPRHVLGAAAGRELEHVPAPGLVLPAVAPDVPLLLRADRAEGGVEAGGPADFALPYWNYDRRSPATRCRSAFRTPTLPDGTPNPLFLPRPRRSARIMAGGQLTATSPRRRPRWR